MYVLAPLSSVSTSQKSARSITPINIPWISQKIVISSLQAIVSLHDVCEYSSDGA
jgi:hypothetical protein